MLLRLSGPEGLNQDSLFTCYVETLPPGEWIIYSVALIDRLNERVGSNCLIGIWKNGPLDHLPTATTIRPSSILISRSVAVMVSGLWVTITMVCPSLCSSEKSVKIS